MSFTLKVWEHCRYVENREHPYDEMVRNLETLAKAGIRQTDIYMPEVISLDDYCRAASAAGVSVEARVFPAWNVADPVNRTLLESELQEMEERFGIRLAKTCGNNPHNREAFLKALDAFAAEYAGRIVGIQLDFIRNDNALLLMDYPCRCDACRALCRRYLGVEVPDRTMLQSPAVLYKFLEIRNANVRKTLAEARRITARHGLTLSIAARANYINAPDITDAPVWGLGPAVLEGQDWVEWAEDGLVDVVNTMNYHTDLTLYKNVLDDHVRLMDGRLNMLQEGIGISSSMGEITPEGASKRLALLRDAGLPGAAFFNKTNRYSQAFLDVFREFAD